MDTMEYFSERLKKLREEKGISQTELGEALGISRSSISFYEKSERVPDIELLSDMARYFEVPVDYLLGLSNAKSTNEPELKAICDYTGLSEEAVKNLHCDLEGSIPYCLGFARIIDKIICYPELPKAILKYGKCVKRLSYYSKLLSAIIESDFNVDFAYMVDINNEFHKFNTETRYARFEVTEALQVFLKKTFVTYELSPEKILALVKAFESSELSQKEFLTFLMKHRNLNKEGNTNGNDNETE